MARHTEVARAEREIVRHCNSSLDAAALQHQVLRSLRRIIPVDAAFFATADPETLLFTSAYTEEPLHSATPAFLANEFGVDDVNKFASLATSAVHVATLDTATRGNRLTSSRSRNIMKPLGLGDELRAALITGSKCWGYLCLHRDDRPLGFTTSEAALVARLGPHIAHALRQATLLQQPTNTNDVGSPGVVLLADDLSVVAVTADAGHLLSLIHDDHPSKLPLPMAVYTVAAALKSAEGNTVASGSLPSTRVQAVDGRWLNVHASRLRGAKGDDRIAVVLEPMETRARIPLLLSAYGLTAREAQIAKLVLRGASTRTITDALHISQHTVQDHLKAVFDKTGVHSRRELVGHLIGHPRS